MDFVVRQTQSTYTLKKFGPQPNIIMLSLPTNNMGLAHII